MSDTKHTAHSPECRLLDTAAELRNRIYRLVFLTEDSQDKIVVRSNGYSRPSLLQTCKQVRSEALKILYYENTFAIQLQSLDFTDFIKFEASISKIRPAQDQPLLEGTKFHKISILTGSSVNWANLLRSTKCSHGHKHKFMYDIRTPEDVYANGLSTVEAKGELVISIVFDNAKIMVDQPWELVERVLTNMRPAFGDLDARWMED